MRITKLSTFDDKRVNSATPTAIHSHFVELYALLESHDMIRKKSGCVFDPKEPFASQYEWNPEKMNRFVTGDETSCHLDITDGLGRFRFVSRGDQKPEKISVPMCNFLASIFGGRRGDGEAFVPMIVVRGGDFKFKSEVTATSTFLVDGAAQEAVWSHNEKGSFDETHVIKYMEEIIAAGTPDLSPENLLIWMVDGVRTHATPAVVRRAHELGIILFLLPPNCTHILQGEDLVNFGIFKNDYNKKKLHYVSDISYSAYILNGVADPLPRDDVYGSKNYHQKNGRERIKYLATSDAFSQGPG